MPIIDDYLREMLSLKGSDLHLSINYPAKYRISGNLKPANDFILTPEFMEKMLKEICLPADRWDTYLQTHDLDFAYEIPGLARFRCNYMYNYYGQAAVSDPEQNSDRRRPQTSRNSAGHLQNQERPCARDRSDRFRKINHACGDDRLHQRHDETSHHHHRGPD